MSVMPHTKTAIPLDPSMADFYTAVGPRPTPEGATTTSSWAGTAVTKAGLIDPYDGLTGANRQQQTCPLMTFHATSTCSRYTLILKQMKGWNYIFFSKPLLFPADICSKVQHVPYRVLVCQVTVLRLTAWRREREIFLLPRAQLFDLHLFEGLW